MPKLFGKILLATLLAVGLESASGYSLLGPIGNGGDAWQVPTIGYGFDGEIGAPKNLGEEYRLNVPVIYYAYDTAFLDYFGLVGSTNVDGAFVILNSLTNVSSYNQDLSLSGFATSSEQINYTAQGLGLTDLKSVSLGLLIEHMGLAEPDRYTWTLHDRFQPPNTTCPNATEYLVVQRNFDSMTTPLNQIQYSTSVNGTLYAYQIVETCSTTPQPEARTFPYLVDPLQQPYTPVAAFGGGGVFIAGVLHPYPGLVTGGFYTGLTIDDVAGLRYLMSSNNINFESAPAGSVLISSSGGGVGGLGPPFALTTLDYGGFAQAALTNNPATLVTLYPGLVVSSSISFLAVVTNGAGLIVVTNYVDTFANLVIITNDFRTNTSAQLQTMTVAPPIGAPFGSPAITNISIQTITLTNTPSGDFYINPNFICGPIVILSPQPAGFPLTNVVATTNLISATTNSAGQVTSSQSLVTFSTTHVFIAQAPICATATTNGVADPGTALRQGIERVQFVRANYDSLIGQFFQPITNNFTAVIVTNSQPVVQFLQRVITAPDIIFDAFDIPPNGPASDPAFFNAASRSISFDQTTVLTNLAGPGMIRPFKTISFNKNGPIYFNTSPFQMNGPSVGYGVLWGSFDGTTNAPVVYPNGTSIADLEAELLIQISPASPLTNATKNVAFSQTFTVTGGHPPYTWAAPDLTNNVPGTGWAINPATGVLSGTPTASGTFNFTLQLTDSLNRVVNLFYSLVVP